MFYFSGLSFFILMRAQRQNNIKKKPTKKTKDTGRSVVRDSFLKDFFLARTYVG